MDEKVTDVRRYIDTEFAGVYRDTFNVIEIAFTGNTEIGKKVKELVGKRLSIFSSCMAEAIDSLYSKDFKKSLPPVGTGRATPKEE